MKRSAPAGLKGRVQAGARRTNTAGRRMSVCFTRMCAALCSAGLAFTMIPAGAAAAPDPRLKPPAPGPAYMSPGDKNRLLAVSKALKARQFSTAHSLTELVEDPIAQSLGEWMYLMAQDPQTDLAEADRFLDSHLQWPAVARISSYVEKRIADDAPAGEVLAFFDARQPVTGEGKIQLARALFSVGDQEGGERQLRDAWINDNFTIAEERRILSVYGRRLTKDDHAARVDRLMWGRQVTNARRVFPYLSAHERRKAEARAALLLQASSGQRLYDRLPEEDRLDSGMLHAAVRHNRRRGQEDRAIALAALAPADPEEVRNGGRWWDERGILMRWALKNGRFADAYKLAAENGMDDGADYAEAEFYAGWIALRFLNEPDRAETHFLALASSVGSPISVSRAYYWLGRTAAAQGDADHAKAYYAKAADHYYSYYGQLAAEEGGIDLTDAIFSAQTESTPADRALFTSRPAVAALRMLTDLNLDYEFMVFAYHVDDELERPGEYIELAKITEGEGAPHLTVRAGKVAIQRGAFAPEVAYPLVFVPEEAARFVSPEIILGLSRQESEFNPRAYSRAGARGVMQLIPSTAQITARKEGLSYSRSALLDDPVYNMTLGSAHLSHLIDRFDGSLIMTLASYNAGASRVNRWIEEYGDPRSDAVDPLDWVELIPFSETRNYVQRVLENTQVYRGRLNNKPIPGRLAGDIERGGARGRIASQAPPSVVLASAAAPFSAAALPPVPPRTVERARRYAMQNPPAPPAASDAAAEDPQGASPIAYETEDAAQAEPRKKSRRRGRNAGRPEAPTPVLTPVAQTEPAADKVALNDADESEPLAPAQKIRQDATPIAAAPAAPRTDENTLPQEETAGVERVEAAQAAPAEEEPEARAIAETVEDATDDLSLTGMSESEYCRAYRDFLERNGLAESEETDLNAAALAELQGEDGTCP